MSIGKEAQARIKINQLLTDAGWRLLDTKLKKANVSLEHRITNAKINPNELGDDFDKVANGFVDYLLLNDQNRPIGLVEAKRERINPLDAKEQARDYARNLGIRHIFLSNGNVHHYWDLEQGNPTVVSRFLSL